jgi:hypothetical protein
MIAAAGISGIFYTVTRNKEKEKHLTYNAYTGSKEVPCRTNVGVIEMEKALRNLLTKRINKLRVTEKG